MTAGIGAFFEPETIGIDTPVTVSGGAIGSAYAATATATGFAAAGLQMFASSGNPAAMTNFVMNKMVDVGTKLAMSDIPFASHFAENIGQLAGKAMELSEQAQKACETP